jgi:hypothetical protein
MKFLEFKQQRYNCRPYDLAHNTTGFSQHTIYSSDISAHLPILEYFASLCDHTTEFGVRNCYSTAALLSGTKKEVISYDIEETNDINLLKKIHDIPCKWTFRKKSTSDKRVKIKKTDLLFIDTLHTYKQVNKELKIHSEKVDKYLIFHDTYSQWNTSLDVPGEEGIGRAIEEFMQSNPNWQTIYRVNFNHGLLILEKK